MATNMTPLIEVEEEGAEFSSETVKHRENVLIRIYSNIYTVKLKLYVNTQKKLIYIGMDSPKDFEYEEKKPSEISKLLLTDEFEITMNLYDHMLVNSFYVLTEILSEKNWMLYIELFHRKTLCEVAAYAYMIAIFLFKTRFEDEKFQDLVKTHLMPGVEIDEIKEVCSSSMSMTNKINKLICLKLGEILDIIFSSIRGLRESQRIQLSVIEVMYIDEFCRWHHLIRQYSQTQPNAETSAHESINTLQNLTLTLKNKWKEVSPKDADNNSLYEYRKFLSSNIKEYFDEKGVVKKLSEQGIVSSVNSLGSLVNEVCKMLSSEILDDVDRRILTDVKGDLMEMIVDSEKLPLSVILDSNKSLMDSLIHRLGDSDNVYLRMLVDRLTGSVTFHEAWYNAVRLKGILYEKCFALSNGLPFATEGQKFSLRTIIKLLYPKHYTEFLSRSSQHHEIRDFKPDFFIPWFFRGLRPRLGDGQKPKSLKMIMDALTDFEFNSETSESEENPLIAWLRGKEDLSELIQTILASVKNKKNKIGGMISYQHDEAKGTYFNSDVPKVSYIEEETEIHLLLIEVGYQTNAESKMTMDLSKWQDAVAILAACNIKCTVVAISESTEMMKSDSWLSPGFAQDLSRCIGSLFGKLSTIMPSSQSSILVSEVSTQKFRSITSVGRSKTCPVNSDDIINCHLRNKDEIFIRPGGARIPEIIQKKFVKTHVLGSIINESECADIKDHIFINADKIIDSVERSNLKLIEIDRKAAVLFHLNYLEGEINSELDIPGGCPLIKLSSYKLSNTIKELKNNHINQFSEEDIMRFNNELKEFYKNKYQIHKKQLKHNCSINQFPYCKSSKKFILLDTLRSSKTYQLYPEELSANALYKTNIDELTSLTLPGRNGKQKEMKGKVKELLEYMSSMCSDGFLKSESGLILASYKHIMLKSSTVSSELDSLRTGMMKEDIQQMNKDKDPHINNGNISGQNGNKVKKNLIERLKKLEKYFKIMPNSAINLIKEFKKQIYDTELSNKETAQDLLYRLRPTAIIRGDNLLESINELLKGCIHTDPINNYFKSKKEKVEEMADKFDTQSKYPVVNEIIFRDHLNLCRSLLQTVEEHQQIKLLPNVVDEHMKKIMTRGTIAEECLKYINRVLQLISTFELGRVLKLYSYLCQSFLIAISEMTSSGIKVLKIPNCEMNLIVKVGAKRVTNSSCILTDKNFKQISPRFFFDRSVATLGQSLIYTVAVNLIQILQTQNALSVLDSNFNQVKIDLLDKIKSKISLFDSLVDTIVFRGCDFGTWSDLTKGLQRPWSIVKPMEEYEDGIDVISSHFACLSYIILPAVIRNNRKDNKVLQMIRHPAMLSISKYGFPFGLGSKLDEPRRGMSTMILSRYVHFISFVNLQFSKERLKLWDSSQQRPTELTLSFSLFPRTCNNDRQFTADMYYCHWYNKEMDDFQEGCIRVANEAFEKIFDWEKELEESISKFNELEGYIKINSNNPIDSSKDVLEELKYYKMKILMLMGIKNLNVDNIKQRYLSLEKEPLIPSTDIDQGPEEFLNPPDDEDVKEAEILLDKDVVAGTMLALSRYGSPVREIKIYQPKEISRTVINPISILKREKPGSSGTSARNSSKSVSDTNSSEARKLRRATFSFDNISESSTRTIKEIGISLTDSDLKRRPKHRLNADYVLKTIIEAARSQKSFSYGSPEFIQLCAQIAKEQYNPINISKATLDSSNNEQISSISETTSILQNSLEKQELATCIKTIIAKDSLKLAKTISKSVRNTSATTEKSKSFSKQLDNLILTPDDKLETGIANLKQTIKELKADSKLSWKDIIKSEFQMVFFSDNVSMIFRLMKTLWKDVKIFCRQEIGGLRRLSKDIFSEISIQSSSAQTTGLTKQEADKNFEILYDTTLNLRQTINKKINETLTNVNVFGNQNLNINQEMLLLTRKIKEVKEKIKQYHISSETWQGSAWPELANKIKEMDSEIMSSHSRLIFSLVVNLLSIQIMSPFTVGINELSKYLVTGHREIIMEIVKDNFEEGDSNNLKANLPSFNPNSSKDYIRYLFYRLFKISSSKIAFMRWVKESFKVELSPITLEDIYELCVKCFFGINDPYASTISGASKKITSGSDISKQIKELISQSGSDQLELDFTITCTDIITGSLASVRRILGKQSKGLNLPKSIRSKVIYQMYELSLELKTTNVQEMGFQILLDTGHRFYGGLAPKAQIGGDRDLIVQERKTKIAVHTNEMFCKSLMKSSVKNDGLTNPKLKEEILDLASKEMLQSKLNHGMHLSEGRKMIYRVYNVIGDCSKWGPIHSTSFFGVGSQQLLSECEGWSQYSMLTMLKSLYKGIEIPTASIEKILRAIINDSEFKKDSESYKDNMNSEGFKNCVLKHGERVWSRNKIAQLLLKNYIVKDKAFVSSYSHMGQGIHHRKSSEHASTMHITIDQLVRDYIESQVGSSICIIHHAGSSDDFSKIIKVTSDCLTSEFYQKVSLIDKTVLKALKLMCGLMRACQMMVSVKSCISGFAAEFYSEFNFFDSVSPPTLKFISNQLINHSVSSPCTLYQGTLVESQQAMYMGVPFLTNLMFSILKQCIFIENSPSFYRRWGLSIMSSFPQFGRFFVPTWSRLVGGSSCQDELQIIISALEKLSSIIQDRFRNRPSKQDQPVSNTAEVSEIISEVSKTKYGDIDYDSSAGETIEEPGLYRLYSSESDLESISNALDSDKDFCNSYDTNVNDETACMISLIAWRYYFSGNPIIEDVGSNSAYHKLTDILDSSTNLRDPFLQILPESVMSEIEKLSEMKARFEGHTKNYINTSNELKSNIAANIISATSLTETYQVEIDRLKQALMSKNIIRGLAGGMREKSVPIHRQMMRGYFFNNETILNISDHWVNNDNSKYLSDNRSNIPGSRRIKYTTFLNFVEQLSLITCESAINYLEGKGLNPEEMLKNCMKPLDLSLKSIPIDLLYIENYSTLEKDYEEGYYLVFEPKKLNEFIIYLRQVRSEITNLSYSELHTAEMREFNGSELNTSSKMKKMSLYSGTNQIKLHNRIGSLIAINLDFDTVLKMKPRDLSTSHITTDIELIQKLHPFLFSWLDETLKLHQKSIGQEILGTGLSDTATQKISSISSECLSYCRMIEQGHKSLVKLFMFYPDQREEASTSFDLLVQNNTIENRILSLEKEKFFKMHDTMVYVIKCVIAAINWIEETEDNKFTLLKQFLNTHIKQFKTLAFEHNIDCNWADALKHCEFSNENETISSYLMSTSMYHRTYHDRRKDEALIKIAQLAVGWSTSIIETPIGGLRSNVFFRGDKENFMFSLSSNSGTVCGSFHSPKLFLTLEGNYGELLSECEVLIFRRLNLDYGRFDPSEMRQNFFKLLPSYSDSSLCNSDQLLFIRIDNGGNYVCNDREFIKGSTNKENYRIATWSKLPVSSKYSEPIDSSKTVYTKWYKNKLEVGVTAVSKTIEIPASWTSIQTMARALLDDKALKAYQERLKSRTQWFCQATLVLPRLIPSHAAALYHIIKFHKSSLTLFDPFKSRLDDMSLKYIDEIERSKAGRSESIDSHKQSITGSEAVEVIKDRPKLSDRVLTEEISQHLSEQSSTVGQLIPIFLLFDYLGISDSELKYTGFSQNYMSSTQKWQVGGQAEIELNSLSNIISSIINLKRREFTRITFRSFQNCKSLNEDDSSIQMISKTLMNTYDDQDLLKFSLILSTLLITEVCIPCLRLVKSSGVIIIKSLLYCSGNSKIKINEHHYMELSKTPSDSILCFEVVKDDLDMMGDLDSDARSLINSFPPIQELIKLRAQLTSSFSSVDDNSSGMSFLIKSDLQNSIMIDKKGKFLREIIKLLDRKTRFHGKFNIIFTQLLDLIWVESSERKFLPDYVQNLLDLSSLAIIPSTEEQSGQTSSNLNNMADELLKKLYELTSNTDSTDKSYEDDSSGSEEEQIREINFDLLDDL
ncbi:RNA-dependent RNA polymerase [Sanxia Water Strider Virus 1]|uniref:RNA-directed RNA polymerase L n=1 Tax=Sanxia Water Strider Virus 1 TaxID=1608060 RepID=A0A0B5KF82_9VIRU|nr:RNA-dependent RNA polymerase [Sanxia Water Strider Virus 1]AJG39244.1 RNA-dependent RNA polymerase [Sanxia Water Strider Virus 1]APG79321.1 RNA-dependent RNA polymerase [Sanxia Water Strider Virus 1]